MWWLVLVTGLALSGADRPSKAARTLEVQGSVRTRLESWDWFDAGSSDPYTFSGTIARLSLHRQYEAFDWQIELAAPILLHLPARSVSPAPQGALGMGANYFSANGNSRNQAMVFPKQAFVRFTAGPGQSLRIGRFEFADGSELAPKNATLAALKTARINMRLLGHFGFTHVGRSFDGFHFLRQKRSGTVTLIGAVPTRGVFQTDGWGWNRAAFGYLSYAKATGTAASAGDLRLFGLYYQDWRHILKTDNRPLSARQTDFANIGIYTWGGHYVHARETAAGTADFLIWGAVQHGRWGRLSHRAAAADVEAGLQPKLLPRLKPWFRGGYSMGSGDGNASDGRHGTFFQVLPTPRPFARFPFFNMMNNDDSFVIATVRPDTRWTISAEYHHLRLAKANDLWFQGGGVFQPWTFGYVGRPSNGSRGLAGLWDISADWKVNASNTLSAYFGHAAGKGVVARLYPKSQTGRFGYIEWSWRF